MSPDPHIIWIIATPKLKKRETGEKELEIIQTNFSEEPVSRFKKVSKNQTQWLLKRLTLKPSVVIFQDTKEKVTEYLDGLEPNST